MPKYNFKDLTGMQFGRLTVIERAENDRFGNAHWVCQCNCNGPNSLIIVDGHSLRSGRTQSCGCLHKEKVTTHNGSGTPLYGVWYDMRHRCNYDNDENYENYGGRGITVCDDWNNDFALFRDWALENGYEQGLTIDRIDNNLGYYPDNCQWTTMKVQCNNRRSNIIYSMNGEAHTLSEWCDIVNLPYKTVLARINDHGWTFEQAITTPIRTYSKG